MTIKGLWYRLQYRLMVILCIRDVQSDVAGLRTNVMCLQDQIDDLLRMVHESLDPNLKTRLKGAENSCRLLEQRCLALEAIDLKEGKTLGLLAADQAAQRAEAKQQSLAESAAKARGQTIQEYVDALAARRKAREANVVPIGDRRA